jgi:hypothetical protein
MTRPETQTKPDDNPPHGEEGHECTARETELYDHMTVGDWDAVVQAQEDLHGQEHREFKEDERNAWGQYQDDHDEKDPAVRLANSQAAVDAANERAEELAG